MNLRYIMFCRTISSVWPEVKVKHCGLLPLTQSEAGACDWGNFVENSVGHDRYYCNFLKSKVIDLISLWYFTSQWMLLNFGHCCEWGLFCIVFYGSPRHRNDTLMWKYWFLLFNWYSLLGAFLLFYWVKQVSASTIQSMKCASDKICLTSDTKTLQNSNFLENRGCMSKISSKSLHYWYQYMFLCILGVEHSYQWWTSGLDRFQRGVRVRGKLSAFFQTLASLRVCRIILTWHLFPNSV